MNTSNVPLLSLRAFEAAARCLSFEKAAAELHVSSSAISQQISRLEAKLAVVLFERLHRRIVLTAPGARFAAALTPAFMAINEAVAEVAQTPMESVRCLVYQTFAARWLIPALPRLAAKWPQLTAQFETGMAEVDFERSNVDVALRFGTGEWPGARSYKLFDEVLVPVCAPLVAQELRTPSHLDRACIIQSANRPDEWRKWRTEHAQGEAPSIAGRELSFSNNSLVYEAALAGNGVALVELFLVADDVKAGRLVIPFPLSLRTPRALYLLEPRHRTPTPGVKLFREWIVEEAQNRSKFAFGLVTPGVGGNKYFDDRNVVSPGSNSSVFISRTAR